MTIVTAMHRLVESACKSAGKWGLYLSYHSNSKEDRKSNQSQKAVDRELNRIKNSLRDPTLKANNELSMALLCEGWALLLLDTEEEMLQLYKGVDGEDTGGLIFAMTCSPKGDLLNENT